MTRLLIFAAMLLVSISAKAEIYRCVENGKTVYGNKPCPAQPVKQSPKPEQEKSAAQLQAEFEAELADKREGERLKAEIEANRQREAAEQKRKLEASRKACQDEKAKPAIVENSGWDGSVWQVKNYLDQVLKDPSSFEAISWGKVMRTCDGYVVFVKYRARNGFGGMTITAQVFTLNKSGAVVAVE